MFLLYKEFGEIKKKLIFYENILYVRIFKVFW